jgi:hypothetical protein
MLVPGPHRIRFGLFAVLSRLGSVNDWAALEQGFARQIGPGPMAKPPFPTALGL